MMGKPFKLYYNELTDQLAIGQDDWDYLCLCRFVPVVRTINRSHWPDAGPAIDFVAHEIAEEKTINWHEVGVF